MSEADATTKPVEEPKVESTEEQKPAEAPETAPEVASEAAKEESKEEPKEEPKEDAKDNIAEKKDANILKTKGKIDYENPQKNRKFDPSTRGVTDDPDAIRKQVRARYAICQSAETFPLT